MVQMKDATVLSPLKFYFVMRLVMRLCPVSRGHGFKSRRSPEFFRLLYAIAKIAFITAKIIALLDFISAVHI